MNSSRGNISNTKKALTEKNGIWNVSIMGSASERCLIPSQHISSSTNSGFWEQKWTRFLSVCLFIWCCLQICYVCTVSSMELFIVSKMGDYQLSEYAITRHIAWVWDEALIERKLIHLQDKTPGFKPPVVSVENIYQPRRQHFGSFQGATLFMWSHRKPELRKNKWPRLFKNGCHWNTNGNENLHVPVAWTAVYLVKLRLKDFWKISVSFFSAQR